MKAALALYLLTFGGINYNKHIQAQYIPLLYMLHVGYTKIHMRRWIYYIEAENVFDLFKELHVYSNLCMYI